MESLFLALLQGQWTLDNVLADIIFLGEIEEFANVAGAFWTETTRNVDVSESGNFLFTLADDNQSESGQVLIDNAAAD